MSTYMNEDKSKEIDIAALLDTYTYLDAQGDYYSGKTIKAALKEMDARHEPCTKTDEYKYLWEIAKSDKSNFGDYIVASQSSVDGNHKMALLVGVAFLSPESENNDSKLFVCYRGTGDGRWPDNGVGLTSASSQMQREAEAWFTNTVMAKQYGDFNGDIILSGHSKGGNNAQYVMMSSPYGSKVTTCYSLDGQGFSAEAIERFKQLYGEDHYNRQISKMYAINGNNDYVSQFGTKIISDENTFYINTSGSGFRSYHDIKNMINWESKEGANLYWNKKGDIIIQGDQGPVSKYAERIYNDALSKFSKEEMSAFASTIMGVLEIAMKNHNTDKNSWFGKGDIKQASPDDVIIFCVKGAPYLMGEFNKFGVSEIIKISEKLKEYVSSLMQNGQYWDAICISFLSTILVFDLSVLLLAVNVAVIILDAMVFCLAYYAKVLTPLAEFLNGMVDGIMTFINDLSIWFDSNFNTGYQYALANPLLVVDTVRMRDYASRLTKVNNRVKNVDNRISRLYGKVIKIEDLIGSAQRLSKLIRANVLLGNSPKLIKSAEYLNNAATDFETAEKKIREKKP